MRGVCEQTHRTHIKNKKKGCVNRPMNLIGALGGKTDISCAAATNPAECRGGQRQPCGLLYIVSISPIEINTCGSAPHERSGDRPPFKSVGPHVRVG